MKKNLAISLLIFGALWQNAQNIIAKNVEEKNHVQNSVMKENNVKIFEDYLILSQKAVKKASSSNTQIVDIKILTTVMNERTTVIVSPKSKGIAKITLIIDDTSYEIKVNVKDNKTILTPKISVFEYIQLDLPPYMPDIDLPPDMGES